MLHERQNEFAHAVVQGSLEEAASWCEGASDRIRLGLRVYANNAAHALVMATRDAFPQTAALIGDDFNTFALHYARTAAPSAPVIGDALRAFPAFLGDLAGIDDRAADCARYEQLWLEAYHAADAEPLAFASVTSRSADAFAQARAVFHPAFRLYRPISPAHAQSDEAWLFLGRPHALLRPQLTVLSTALSWAAFDMLERLQGGAAIGEALEARPQADDALQELARLIAAGAITHLL